MDLKKEEVCGEEIKKKKLKETLDLCEEEIPQIHCQSCHRIYCKNCSDTIHSIGKKKTHKPELLKVENKIEENNIKESEIQKEIGNKYFKQSKFENALEAYEKAIKLNPKEPKLFTNSSICSLQLYKFKEALEYSENAYALEKSSKVREKKFKFILFRLYIVVI